MDTTLITTLAQARAEYDRVGKALEQKVKEFRESPAYLEAKSKLDQATLALGTVDEKFREQAKAEYDLSKSKHSDAYDIREDSVVEIQNESGAFGWCLKNMTPALALDKKVFNDAVKRGTVPARLATLKTKVTVLIHSDLSAWLPKLPEGESHEE